MSKYLALLLTLALLLLYRATGRRQCPAVWPFVDDWRVRMEMDYIEVKERLGQ